MSKKIKILTIDGGGIRGVIPAKYLQLIEEKASLPIHNHFDLVVGTSTGGIIALAIGAGIPMNDLVQLFENQGKNIFRKRSRFVLNYLPLLFSKYSNKALSREISKLFGHKTIGDSSVRLCIPAINITSGKTTVYKTRHTDKNIQDTSSRYERDHILPMRDVAMATSAAPFYFPVFNMKTVGRHVDGGLWSNNPSVVGIAEAVKLGYGLHEIELLSLGTGDSMFNDKKVWQIFSGFTGWRTRIIDLTFLSQSQGAHFTAQYLLPQASYKRISSKLPVSFKLDQTSEMNRYLAHAEELYRNTVTEVYTQFFQSKYLKKGKK